MILYDIIQKCLLILLNLTLPNIHKKKTYFRQKQVENKTALALLPQRLELLNNMEWKDKQVELAMGES